MSEFEDSLLKLVEKRFTDAQLKRTTIRMTDGKTVEETLQLCHRAREQQFSEDYLAEKSDDDPLMYYPLTSTKTRTAAAHIYDIMVNILAFPISVDPTPIPELPMAKLKELALRMYDAWTEGQLNADDISREAVRFKAMGRDEVNRVAAEAASQHTLLLKDQFAEGGFNDTLLAFLEDFTMYPTAFMRQRFVMKDRLVWSNSKGGPKVKQSMEREWSVVSPHDVFPSDDAISTQRSTYVIVREHLTKKAFSDQQKLDSFDADAVKACLLDMHAVPEPEAKVEEAQSQGVASDITGAGTSTRTISDARTPPNPAVTPLASLGWQDRYSVTQYTMFGLVTGAEAMTAKGIEKLEPNTFYECEVTWCGKRRIRTVVYPQGRDGDPLGMRPLWGASYRTRSETFWGEGGEKILRSMQRAANASFRDWMINNADSAKPIGALDYGSVSRYTENPTDIYGGKMFLMDNDPTRPRSGQNRVVEFTDIPNHSSLYISSLGEVVRRADEVFGIPAFGHGQSQVGTLGRTFNGMALVYGAALKDLKLSLRGLSKGILAPIGHFNYNYNLKYHPNNNIQGDTQVVIKGPEGIVEREMAQMNYTTNMQQILPLVEAGLLPKELAQAMAIQFARDSGVPVDQYVTNTLAGTAPPSAGAAPGTPIPPTAPSNPAFNQSVNAQGAPGVQ